MPEIHIKKPGCHIILYYLYALLTACVFSRGIFMLFLAHKGLNITQIGIYQMLVQISMFVFEIPTGYIGDRIGKVKSLQIGTLTLIIYCFMIIYLEHPIGLIFLGIIEGLGYTFLSGSDSALLYELLKRSNREQEYLKLNANLQSAQSILTGVTIFIGAAIISWSWNAVYGITAIFLMVALITLLPIKDPVPLGENKINVNKGVLSKIKSTVLYPNFIIFLICVIGFSCFDGISGSYYNYNQILFEQNQIPVAVTGLFFSANYFLASVAYQFAIHLSKTLPKKQVIFRMLIFQGALFTALAFIKQSIVFVAFSFVCCLIPETIYILADSIIQECIESKYRATTLSAISMLRSLTSAISYTVLGSILNQTGRMGFMLFLASITFCIFCCFKFIVKMQERK